MIDLKKLSPAGLRATLLFWWNVTHGAIRLWLERNAFSYAGSLAFYTLFSLAPTMIIAVTVIGLVMGEDAAQGQIVAQLQDTMGHDAAAASSRPWPARASRSRACCPPCWASGP